MHVFRRGAGLAGAILLSVLAGCTVVHNPATGEKFLSSLSPEQEIQLGTEAAPGLEQEFGGKVPNEQLQQYVSNLGKKLAAQTEGNFPSLPWEFTLLNSPVINAFSLPGGKVFFTRGLAERLTNEAQMAGVLGHEIGHVTAQHVAQQLTHQQAFNIGLSAVGLAVGAAGSDTKVGKYGSLAVPALQIGTNLYLLKFSRDDESQADYLGMRYMTKCGYNPEAQMQVMQILKEAAGGGDSIEMLQTHPLPQTRIDDIKKLLQTPEFSFTQNNPNYGFFPERYQQQFLSVIKTLPPAPAPQQAAPQQPQQQKQGQQPNQLRGGRAPAQNQRISRPR